MVEKSRLTEHTHLSTLHHYSLFVRLFIRMTQLETEREAIPDVPAVYFCRPTEENMRQIAADAGKRLYR